MCHWICKMPEQGRIPHANNMIAATYVKNRCCVPISLGRQHPSYSLTPLPLHNARSAIDWNVRIVSRIIYSRVYNQLPTRI